MRYLHFNQNANDNNNNMMQFSNGYLPVVTDITQQQRQRASWEESVQQEQRPSSPLGNFVIVFFSLVGISYVGSSLFFLLSGNIQSLRTGCAGMWEVFLSRILVSIFLTSVLLFDYYCYWSFLFFLRGIYSYIFFFLYFLIFSIVQYIYYPGMLAGDSANCATCIKTIEMQSPTGTNILGPLAWVSLSLDSILLLCYGYCVLFKTGFFCSKTAEKSEQSPYS